MTRCLLRNSKMSRRIFINEDFDMSFMVKKLNDESSKRCAGTYIFGMSVILMTRPTCRLFSIKRYVVLLHENK